MFQPNINSRGRALRACGGCAFAVAGAATWPHSRVAAGALGLIAAFMFSKRRAVGARLAPAASRRRFEDR